MTPRLALLALLALAAGVLLASGATTGSDQPFVVVGESAIEQSLAANPELELPVLLVETAAAAKAKDVNDVLLSPWMLKANARIAADHALLSRMELMAQQLGANIVSEHEAEQSQSLVQRIAQALATKAKPEGSHVRFVDAPLPTELLQQAPVAGEAAKQLPLSFVELGVDVAKDAASASSASSSSSSSSSPSKHDYAWLDDPKSGGSPRALQNLQGLDIYVVNTPVAEADNEIRPVAPPRPMSAAMREKAKLAAKMRAQLVHDVPQPQARVKPKTRINTLSAYESSLSESRPLSPISRLQQHTLDDPLVGGHGAIQLRGAVTKQQQATAAAAGARFAQLGLDSPAGLATPPAAGSPLLANRPDLPHYPRDPNAAPVEARAYGTGSSFDNRDGPPVLLDDLLPVKATLVEDLEPYIDPPARPVGW